MEQLILIQEGFKTINDSIWLINVCFATLVIMVLLYSYTSYLEYMSHN